MRFFTLLFVVAALPAAAQLPTPQTLPFLQNWSDTNLLTTENDWSNVPGIIGFRGDDLTTAIGVDPQTILADGAGTPVNVLVNRTAPNTLTNGGIAEFEIADPVVALQGSGTADAPHLVIRLNTTGETSIRVRYNVRDIDGSADNAVQQVALHYRVGGTGDYINVPEAFIADATTGPNEATLVTPVDVVLPPAADNQPLLELRIMTANAPGNDEWVGIDDIQITTLSVGTEAGPDAALWLSVPNPIAGTATVRYASPTTPATLILYDALGRQAATLDARAGTATLDAARLAPGAYVLRLTAGEHTLTRRVSVVR